MTSFDKIVEWLREHDPYRAEVLLEMDSRLNIAAALLQRVAGDADLRDPEVHKLLFDYYDRVCDAFMGEFDEEEDPPYGSHN